MQNDNPILFDAKTLAALYTYAIGLNDTYGADIARQWNGWTHLVPQSFVNQVEIGLAKNFPFYENKIIEGFQPFVISCHLNSR